MIISRFYESCNRFVCSKVVELWKGNCLRKSQKAWKKEEKKKHEILHCLLDPDGNFLYGKNWLVATHFFYWFVLVLALVRWWLIDSSGFRWCVCVCTQSILDRQKTSHRPFPPCTIPATRWRHCLKFSGAHSTGRNGPNFDPLIGFSFYNTVALRVFGLLHWCAVNHCAVKASCDLWTPTNHPSTPLTSLCRLWLLSSSSSSSLTPMRVAVFNTAVSCCAICSSLESQGGSRVKSRGASAERPLVFHIVMCWIMVEY